MAELKIDLGTKQIEKAVNAAVSGAIVAALSDKEADLIGGMINSVLHRTVDKDGKERDWGTPFIEWVATGAVRAAIKEGMREYVESKKDEIKARVKDRLSKEKDAFIDQIATRTIEKMTPRVHSVTLSVGPEGGD